MKILEVKSQISLKNILFATDYSKAANAALPYVTGIARRYGSKVFALHVVAPEVPPTGVKVSAIAWPDMLREKEKRHREEAGTLEPQLADVPHEIVIGEGDTWAVISKVIEDNQIDLVVIGTRGRSGVEKVLLGSVAEKIFREAPCPVLTVGPHATADAQHLLEMTDILFATDFTPESLAGVPYAVSLAQERHAKLTVLYVEPNPETGDLVNAEQYVDSTLRRLRELIPASADLHCAPKFLVRQGEAAEKILEVAKACSASLIVLGVRHPRVPAGVATHLAGGTAHKVVVRAECPVLTVRG
jgi:nucleotide-binding universal stress UspA family protein